MTHWYREPKQIKLIEHLERAGIDFVLCSLGFAETDLQNLKASLPPIKLVRRLTLGAPTGGDGRKVLIVARCQLDPEWLRNPEPWAGVLVLPGHSPDREQALQHLLAPNRSFQNGARGRRAISRGILRRFVLDMRTTPPSLYGIREAATDPGSPKDSN